METGTAPHLVIQGDNLDALHQLTQTHTGRINCIYIDPPYNTGNQSWIYTDRNNDWTGFMRPRLELARTLLTATGIIAVSIGDEEHHRLRILMDEVFGPATFIANLIWQGQPSGTAATTAGVDYIVIHTRTAGHRPEWREPKPGVSEAADKARHFWNQTGGDVEAAQKLMRAWWNGPGKHHPRGLRDYTRLSPNGRLYRPGPLAAPDNRGNRSRRPLTHPVTGKPCKVPPLGWRAANETMDQLLAEDMIEFGPDETVIPTRRYYLDQQDWQRPPQVFYSPRRSNHLDNLLGQKRFPYPKDHEVLMRWLRMWAPADGIILDFFAGSGSTLEAVLRLNAEDDGTRECILVTNNEVSTADQAALKNAGYRAGDPEWETRGVFEYVTKPRIGAVLSGLRPDGSRHGDPVPGEVVFRTQPAQPHLSAGFSAEFDQDVQRPRPCVTERPGAAFVDAGAAVQGR